MIPGARLLIASCILSIVILVAWSSWDWHQRPFVNLPAPVPCATPPVLEAPAPVNARLPPQASAARCLPDLDPPSLPPNTSVPARPLTGKWQRIEDALFNPLQPDSRP